MTESIEEEQLEHTAHPIIQAFYAYRENLNNEGVTIQHHILLLDNFRKEINAYETPFWANKDMILKDQQIKIEMLKKIDDKISRLNLMV